MKTLKLNVLASENLSKVEMNQVKGGATVCGCSCYYASSGGSSSSSNGSANVSGNLYSTKGENVWVICDC